MICPNDAQWFWNVIGIGIVINLRDMPLFSADAAGEIAEMIDRQSHVGRDGFADRLAIVDGFGHGQHLGVGFHQIRDLEQHV